MEEGQLLALQHQLEEALPLLELLLAGMKKTITTEGDLTEVERGHPGTKHLLTSTIQGGELEGILLRMALTLLTLRTMKVNLHSVDVTTMTTPQDFTHLTAHPTDPMEITLPTHLTNLSTHSLVDMADTVAMEGTGVTVGVTVATVDMAMEDWAVQAIQVNGMEVEDTVELTLEPLTLAHTQEVMLLPTPRHIPQLTPLRTHPTCWKGHTMEAGFGELNSCT